MVTFRAVDRTNKSVSIEELVNIANFVLENNYVEFNGKSANSAPPYACIVMDEVETKFPEIQVLTSLVWFRYRDNVFLFGLMHMKNLKNLSQS